MTADARAQHTMIEYSLRNRLAITAWVAIFLACGFLAGETVATIRRVGLTGARPPLPAVHTALRVLIMVVALALVFVFRRTFERVALIAAAAAAASTALYGFGLRSAGLSAFRLLSHVAAYVLLMLVAGRRIIAAHHEQT